MKPGKLTRLGSYLLPTLQSYQRCWLTSDLTAGLIVAVLIVPQAIAYAFLAGLPAETGLYAALLPLLFYALLGTSPTLAVGPVAIVSLMTLEALSPLATDELPLASYASLLALLVAGFLLLFFLIGLGRWTAFISHTVISAFTSAAALIIILNQMRHFAGIEIPRNDVFFQPFLSLWQQADQINVSALVLGSLMLVLLLAWPRLVRGSAGKTAPLLAILLGIAASWSLDTPLATVGAIPAGLPDLEWPRAISQHWQQINWRALLPSAAIIALIAYLESLSVATAMALQSNTRLNPNRELLALASANMAAAVSQAYPVAGGFGRSMVNQAAGARSQAAALVTMVMVALVCLFFSDWFVHLPKAVLAAIIVAAVLPLIKWSDGVHAWHFQRGDGLTWLITFTAVLLTNAETGIFIGICVSLVLFLKRTSEPHIAEVGRYQDSDHFRNIERHTVTTSPELLLVRVDENLYFANSQHLQDYVQQRLQQQQEIQHVILIGSAINHIDFDGYEGLIRLNKQLQQQQKSLHLAEFKGPVMDQLQHSQLFKQLQPGQIFFTASEAMRQLGKR